MIDNGFIPKMQNENQWAKTPAQSIPGGATVAAPDAIVRIKELLNLAIDSEVSNVHRVQSILNELLGVLPTPEGNCKLPPTPNPPLKERSIYDLLAELETFQRAMDRQLSRIREQLP